MAPEQIDRTLGEISPATDVYGLGALLFALCCGRPPHRGGSISTIMEQVAQASDETLPDSLCESVPNAARAICARCLARQPQNRFSSAAEVAGALRLLRSETSQQ
jgi:serine/threonine-protein kinase